MMSKGPSQKQEKTFISFPSLYLFTFTTFPSLGLFSILGVLTRVGLEWLFDTPLAFQVDYDAKAGLFYPDLMPNVVGSLVMGFIVHEPNPLFRGKSKER